MIGKFYEFNGQTISNTTGDYRVWLSLISWKDVVTSDDSINIQWGHWIKTSITFARGRLIQIEWSIIADTREWLSKGEDYLSSLFALQSDLTEVELLPLIITDEQDRRWRIYAKIKESLSIEIGDNDYIDGTNRRFRVVLEAEDPKYYNVDQKEVNTAEGNFGGAKLGAKLWVKLNSFFNKVELITESNHESPLFITINVTGTVDTPLTIHNTTTGTFFWLDISAINGDVIVINSKDRTATKNWVNVLANRVSWSIWPKAKGTTNFSIFDNDGGLAASDFNINIIYNDVYL